jgi:hypothetical protein
MIRITDHLVLTPRLTPTEAHMLVMAWCSAEEGDEPRFHRIEGQVVGPLCEYAETLSVKSPVRPDTPLARRQPLRARARILEPCFWEPAHPFCYEMHLELHDEERLLDMRRIVSGIRHLAVARRELLLNGQELFLRGVRHRPDATIEELEAWHEVDCTALLVAASEVLCARTDRWGPMVLHILPRTKEEARVQVIKLRNHPSVLIWVVPPRIDGRDLEELLGTIKAHDPSRLIGQLVAVDEPIHSASPVDMFILPAGHWAIGSAKIDEPYAVLGDMTADPDVSQFENFTNQTEELRESLGSPPGLVGVIL